MVGIPELAWRRCAAGALVGLLTVGTGAAPAAADVPPEVDDPPGCEQASFTNEAQCGARGRSNFGNEGHVAPVEACATSVRPSGSTITRILPDGPLRQDGSLAFIPGACVYLPPGYDTDGLRYPVLYLLHGGGGDQADWVTFGDVGGIVDAAVAADPANGLIVVMPDGANGQWYDAYDGSMRNESYVLDHLVPAVDEQFATIADRRGRAIAGLSNGGYGALHLAAKAPDEFAAAGAISGNLAALSFSGLGTPVVPGGPQVQELGAHYYGSIPLTLAQNLDPVDLVIDWGARCSSDLVVDACATFGLEQVFGEANRAFRRQLDAVGYAGNVDYREAEGSHAWRWWTEWLTDRHLPFLLERLADPQPIAEPVAASHVPERFRYRSVKPAFEVFGYEVAVERSVLELLDLREVTAERIEVAGSGSAVITTAPRYEPGGSYVVDDGEVEKVQVADGVGRLRLEVDLGPSHTAEQWSLGARLQQDQPGYFTTKSLAIRLGSESGAPGPGGSDGGATAAGTGSSGGEATRLPATGRGAATVAALALLGGGLALRRWVKTTRAS